MPQYTVVFTGSNVRQANGRNGVFTVYELTDDQGIKWQAKKPIFDQAIQFMNVPLAIEGDVKQNGTFTNYYLNGFPGALNQQPQPAVSPAPAPAVQVAPQVAQVAPSAPPPPPAPQGDEQKNLSIHRQVAAKVAIQAPKDLPPFFWQNTQDLVNFFQSGVIPQPYQPDARTQPATTGAPAAPTPDDIPF